MSKIEKLIVKLQSHPKGFTWDELIRVMKHFDFVMNTGKGSRRAFVSKTNGIIFLHEPYPTKIIKPYQIKTVLQHLRKEELL
ncbi:MAG: type II toxin-antitoxin system HicA family toxin [Cytophagales bacterium]|nr:type II toxin-antitoxin system HicA family toxin [Cytophagales bacterium]